MANTIVCVAGPTASGKTTLGVLLAQKFHGEVVSADSMQIYRGMAVGSAAPTEEETGGVPHHLIGIAEPEENWSAARYVEAAVPVVDGILRRGNLPIVVGGTGLWMDALVKGRVFAPGKSGGAIRQELERRLEREGISPLLEELRTVDPEAAARLHPADTKRVLRALEVYRESGETITAHDRRDAALPPRYSAVWIGLRFRNRADLRSLIARRVDAMLEGGLLDEVRALYGRNLPQTATAWQAIGYKELRGVLEGEKPLSDAAEEIRLRTGQYAKRQETWFRKNPAMHWIEWEKERDFSRAVQISTEIFGSYGIC